MKMLRLSSLLIAALTLGSAAMAQEEEGPEAIAARYFSPPPGYEMEYVVTREKAHDAGALALAGYLSDVELALDECRQNRTQMEWLLSLDTGSYSVHPGWIRRYQDCLKAREQEIEIMGEAITNRRTALLGQFGGEEASRTANSMAELDAFRTQLKISLRREFEIQKDLIEAYNAGGL